MAAPLQIGLYEDLLTESLQDEITCLSETELVAILDSAQHEDLPDILARHVYALVLRTLKGVKGSDQSKVLADRVSVVNSVVETLASRSDVLSDKDQITQTANILLEVAKRNGVAEDAFTPRPTLPLRQTGLLVNGRQDVQIAHEIVREIPSADRIDLLCAFIRYSGLRLYKSQLEQRIRDGASVRVIASVYTGSTERRALDELVKIGAKVKVSYDKDRTRLHAKAWLFHRKSGFHTAYIGSSNLTHSAQVDGLEWNVRLSAVENPEVIDRFNTAFDQYWGDAEFRDYDPEHDADFLDKALERKRDRGDFLLFDVAPKPHQSVALEALESERERGHLRNLIVAATGTGKTWIAAFDFKHLLHSKQVDSLLFVAHRKEILEQSRLVFQHVLHDSDFGELMADGESPNEGRFVFASIQSLQNRVDSIDPTQFDALIVDEFHHAAADSYDRLLQRLEPKILLGLTATPERADGKSVLDWFDQRIAYESRLWDALEQGLLCPFHYFGVNDPTDMSDVQFERGRYVTGELDNLLTGNDMRAGRIRDAVRKYVQSPKEMRALGFCASVEHARFMAEKFNTYGWEAKSLDAATPRDKRRQTRKDLRNGKIRAIFTVDLFNEGVDLPEVDTVLLLRPTESATVFLQQLGRGLRLCEDKRELTVLDFVGQAHREYRYEIRYQAMAGGTRKQVGQAIESDFPFLPPGCAIQLDRIAKETILNHLKQSIKNSRKQIVRDLAALDRRTHLAQFIAESEFDLEDIYSKNNSNHCFTKLREQAGHIGESGPLNSNHGILRAIGHLTHADDRERIELWRKLIKSNDKHPISSLTGRKYRLGLMLLGILGKQGTTVDKADLLVDEIRSSPELQQEICDLLDILEDRIRSIAEPLSDDGDIPLASHATYSLSEISAAYNRIDRNRKIHIPKEGVVWDKETQTDLLFITLVKSEKDYSAQTLYKDYPVSPTLFHWMSQNSASSESVAGQRYINQKDNGTNVVLFVREHKHDTQNQAQPYVCLGPAHYIRHESERPMKIIWELERPMPGWLYQAGKAVAG